MNKTELVAFVAEEAGITKAVASDAIDATFNAIVEALKKGEEVRIIGFGNFQVSDRPAAIRRNPATGEKKEYPAIRVPKFKAGKNLKEAVRDAA